MISGEEIGNLIRNPLALKADDLSDFSTLIEKYPYCSSLQIIYLKGLAIHNHIDFEKQLKSTAIHSADRAHLYALIHSEETEIEPVEELVEETIQISTEAIEKEVAVEEIEIPDTDIQLESNPKEKKKEAIVLDPLDVDILNTAIDVSYLDSGFETKENTRPETEAAEVEPIKEIETEIIPEEVDIVAKVAVPPTSNEPLTFIEWLRQKQKGEIAVPPADEPISEVESKPVKKSKSEINALLNKFMKEEPRISKPIKEFYNPVANARKSVEESDNLVSETLAKIHVMQKNYSKAISAYEKLILLYPEKKTFFASQIEKIREEIKNK